MAGISERPASERGIGFLPNPNETVPPPTARDALEDRFRYLASLTSREEVRRQVGEMDPVRIIEAVQGTMVTDRPLNGFELMVGNAIEYCIQNGLLKSPVKAIFVLASVKFDLLNRGGVFVGQERTPRQ